MRTNRKSRSQTKAALSVVIAASLTAGAAMNACGNDSFSSTGNNDASSATDGTSDAVADDVFIPPPADAGRCDLSMPFGMPKPITELNTANNEQTARLTHDELTMYFQAQQISAAPDAGVGDAGDGGDAGLAVNMHPIVLKVSTRSTINDNWGAPVVLSPTINGAGNNSDPSITADNQTLYFTSDRADGIGLSDIWTAQNGGSSGFVSPHDVNSIDTMFEDSQPYVMPDGLTIYYRSRGTATSFLKLYRATRTASGTTFTVDTSTLFNSINIANGIQELPTVPPDELTIYYTSNALEGGSSRDIWKATRSTTGDVFGTPSPVDELNTSASDEASWISDDGCRIYISSSINGTSDLFVASKPAK